VEAIVRWTLPPLLVVGVLCGSASALDVPPLTGRIVDLAHVLSPDLAASLSEELAAHERRTGNQVAVLTIPSLQGEPLEEFSHRVATTWGLGKKGTDNGVLVLVVPGDRRVRIEVGYGLEGVLTDAMTSRIIRNEMVPRFRGGDYAQGIASGVRAVLGTIEGTYTAVQAKPAESGGHGWGIFLAAVIVGAVAGTVLGASRLGLGLVSGGMLSFVIALSLGLLLALLAAMGAIISALVFSALFSGGTGGRQSQGIGGPWLSPGLGGGWSGGFGGGGGFSGGGGSFGGGGASGSW